MKRCSDTRPTMKKHIFQTHHNSGVNIKIITARPTANFTVTVLCFLFCVLHVVPFAVFSPCVLCCVCFLLDAVCCVLCIVYCAVLLTAVFYVSCVLCLLCVDVSVCGPLSVCVMLCMWVLCGADQQANGKSICVFGLAGNMESNSNLFSDLTPQSGSNSTLFLGGNVTRSTLFVFSLTQCLWYNAYLPLVFV